MKGEIVGLEKYNPGPVRDGKAPDLTRAVLAIQASALGELASVAEGAGVPVDRTKVSSVGDFASTAPDGEDVCRVPTLTLSQVAIPPIDGGPGTDLRYAWSNVRVRVTPAYPGTQMAADLTLTQNGCTAKYEVLGLWPAVGCEQLDENGNGTGQPDASRCSPEADPDAGRPTGSGINPDFQSVVACDPDLLLCVLTEVPEALR
jgi:hypothetical protein